MGTNHVPEIVSPAWSNRTKRTVGVIVVILLGIFAWRLSDVWPPLIISLILAYLLSPQVNWFERRFPFGGRKARRTIGTTVTFILAVTGVVIAFLILIPAIIAQLEQFGEEIPLLVEEIGEEVSRILSSPITIGDQTIVPLEVIQEMTATDPNAPAAENAVDLHGFIQGLLTPLATPILGALGSALSGILTLVFVLVMTFYFMKDGPVFIENIRQAVPAAYRDDYNYLMHRLGRVWDAYLRGQILLCVSMGFAGFFSALILGLPSPLILGLINGILEFIPNVGPALALIPATLFALIFPSTTIPGLHGVVFALVVIITWTALQNLEAIILVPRIMGGNLDLHPVIVIAAVIGGASVAGALGIILAAPIVATLRVLGEYIYIKLFDVPPPSIRHETPGPGGGIFQRVFAWLLRVTGRRSSSNESEPLPTQEKVI